MNVLVIGYGSIGKRHCRILSDLGCNVVVISEHNKQIESPYPTFNNLTKCLDKQTPEYVVIANETIFHFNTVVDLIKFGFSGYVLVEKPLFHKNFSLPDFMFKNLFVGYNLRFHPLIQKLHNILQNENIISTTVYVGEYLPNWRPGYDYKLTYSALKEMGGGVLRDLSHELDYINWLMGRWEKLIALGGKYSSLEIDSDDVFTIMMTTKKCPVINIQMNYLDKAKRREIIINTEKITIKVDLINGFIEIDNGFIEIDGEEIYKDETIIDQTYIQQHKEIIYNTTKYICTANQGVEVNQIIEAAEKSNSEGVWIYR